RRTRRTMQHPLSRTEKAMIQRCRGCPPSPRCRTPAVRNSLLQIRSSAEHGTPRRLSEVLRAKLKTIPQISEGSMKFGVVIFPGSNCDHDAFWAIQHVAKQPVTFLWHESHELENCDAVIVPGGFSYGDYLRTGAIAKFSPVMESVRKFAAGGGLVLGICNGFQILCESGLLPGALMRNVGL